MLKGEEHAGGQILKVHKGQEITQPLGETDLDYKFGCIMTTHTVGIPLGLAMIAFACLGYKTKQ